MTLTDIEQLAQWRTLGARRSYQVLQLATRVLKQGTLHDQQWAVREQLAIAALDLGQLQLAEQQLSLLKKQFSGSSRVELLRGLHLEASGDVQGARDVYHTLLRDDECNVSAHQRLISMHLSVPQQAITHLLAYLDTFYSDPQAWSLLADLYADLGLYAQSLSALGHLMLIQTWDSHAVTRAGEVAYTLGDFQLALKHFLRATEMETPSSGEADSTRTRSWWGVKLAVRRLREGVCKIETCVPDNARTTREQLDQLDVIATKRLLAAGGAGMSQRRKALGA